MKTVRPILAGLAVLALSGLVAGPAQAATQHCAGHDAPGAGKVELSGDRSSVRTDLADGTVVCVKAGTQTTQVAVVDGTITQTAITNKKGKPLGISYFVPGKVEGPGGGEEQPQPEPQPCDPICPV